MFSGEGEAEDHGVSVLGGGVEIQKSCGVPGSGLSFEQWAQIQSVVSECFWGGPMCGIVRLNER